MGMSTHVVGIRPPDEKWKKMKAAWDACVAAGVAVPPDVERFFNGERPDDAGVLVDLSNHSAYKGWRKGESEGVEIDLMQLPVGITRLRFYNSF